MASSKFKAFWNHPAGLKTIHFWAPTFKWGLSIANVADFAKPPETISYPQQIVVAASGLIWTRYGMVITPRNWNLCSVNFAMSMTGFCQLTRKIGSYLNVYFLSPPSSSSSASTFYNDQLLRLCSNGFHSLSNIPDEEQLSTMTSIYDGLKRLYEQKLKPLELTYQFNDFASPVLTDSDFDAKPMVMLLGQYSTGKTTFIKHLLKSSYPGAHVGPEPTTDRFIVIMSGPDERRIPGNTISVQEDMPYKGLTTFGSAFLSKFECSQMPHPLLEHMTLIDTPGVLSGEKQRIERSYDFTGVTSWFAAKCDLILLLFDPHKLDISDEFKRVISSLQGHDDKIRVVLNKADQVDTQQLMRIYGALMWSLGKVLNTPEVTRVYIGSFNDGPLNEAVAGQMVRDLFLKEQNDLLADLKDIPKNACNRRVNEFVKRARAAKIHALIISHLKKEMPVLIGKAKAQESLIENLEVEFRKIQREYHLPAGDFPNVEHFQEVLRDYNIDKFEKLKPKLIQAVDEMLGYDIPELLRNLKSLDN